MKEDFVSCDIAVKLKEKGYPQNGNHYYNEKGNIDISAYNLSDEDMSDTIAPQIHEVLKWLREEKHLFVDISLCASGYYGYIYSTIFPKDKDFSDGWMFEGKYDTYESAALAGIWHVLENLI